MRGEGVRGERVGEMEDMGGKGGRGKGAGRGWGHGQGEGENHLLLLLKVDLALELRRLAAQALLHLLQLDVVVLHDLGLLHLQRERRWEEMGGDGRRCGRDGRRRDGGRNGKREL